MSTMLEQLVNVEQKQAAERSARLRSAASEYRQLVRRHDDPKSGDAERLQQVMADLNIDLATFQGDIRDLNRETTLKQRVLSEDEQQRQIAEIDADLGDAATAAIEALQNVVALVPLGRAMEFYRQNYQWFNIMLEGNEEANATRGAFTKLHSEWASRERAASSRRRAILEASDALFVHRQSNPRVFAAD